MILLTSAAYVQKEMQVEFGKLPPSFLPLGGTRLFSHQIRLLKNLQKNGESIYISLPDDFLISDFDAECFKKHGIKILKVPASVSLAESVYHCTLEVSKKERLLILHGDTLFTRTPNILDEDYFSIQLNGDVYERGYVTAKSKSSEKEFFTGLFVFRDLEKIHELLAKLSFETAINKYFTDAQTTGTVEDSWLDFGHLNSYFQSRTKFTTQRHFNDLVIDGGFVTKSSSNKTKITNEAKWFESLPEHIKIRTPRYFGLKTAADKASYSLEYLQFMSLSEFFVFGALKTEQWATILNEVFDTLDDFRKVPVESSFDLRSFVVEKTKQRFLELETQAQLQELLEKADASVTLANLKAISDKYIKVIEKSESMNSFWHGDLGLSNMLYDYRLNRVYLLDPRATDHANKFTAYGDLQYDLAKLMHSFIGLYDHIIFEQISEGELESLQINEAIQNIQQEFLRILRSRYPSVERVVYAVMMHLFLSMLPLHTDKPQKFRTLIENIYRLDRLYDKKWSSM